MAGFTPLVPAQSYGPENLSDKIDGKAELYLSAGFKEMSCRSFGLEDPRGAHVEVFVYDMGSAQNAYAVFSGQRRPGAPSISLTANAYATTNALFFTQGEVLCGDRGWTGRSEALPKSLEAYATALLAKIPSEGETGNAAALFPRKAWRGTRVRLYAADTFGLEGLNNVLTGEYT